MKKMKICVAADANTNVLKCRRTENVHERFIP